MKIRLLIITALLLLGTQAAHAGLFGWHGSVTFTNGVNNFDVNFSGPSYSDCELQRSWVKTLYSPPTFAVVSESACVPLIIGLDKFLIPEKKIRWPEPPCLSCPYLQLDILERIYPEQLESVIRLMDEYRIDEYNRALDELNSQFDMEGFGKEMYLLEKEAGQQFKR